MQPLFSRKIFPIGLGILMLVLFSIVSCQSAPPTQPSPTPNLLSTAVAEERTRVVLLVTPTLNETNTGKPAETVTAASTDEALPLPAVAAANGTQISLEQVDETDRGYILKGRISKEPNLMLDVRLGFGTELLDAQGNVIPTAYYLDQNGGTIQDVSSNWGLQTQGKNYPGPWRLNVASLLIELSKKVSFAVDLGPEPHIGQVWELNAPIDYAGHTLVVQKVELFQSEKNRPCLKFSFAGGPEIFRVTSVDDPENRTRGKNIQVGDASSGEIFHSACYDQMPVGTRRIDIYSVDVIQQGPWTLRWQPPNSNAPQPTTSLPTAAQSAVISDPAAVIKNCEEVVAVFNNQLKTTGWIRTVHTIVYFDNIQKEYQPPKVMEQWYRLDPEGQLVEGYTWLSTPDGAVEQETLFQGGIWYNVTLGGSSHSYNTKTDFSGGIVDGLKNGEKITQEAVRYHDREAWRFFYELNDGGLRMARAMFFDRERNLLSGNETYVAQPDGSLQLVSGTIYTSFEINADPPLDRFQQILAKAQKMH